MTRLENMKRAHDILRRQLNSERLNLEKETKRVRDLTDAFHKSGEAIFRYNILKQGTCPHCETADDYCGSLCTEPGCPCPHKEGN